MDVLSLKTVCKLYNILLRHWSYSTTSLEFMILAISFFIIFSIFNMVFVEEYQYYFGIGIITTLALFINLLINAA